MSKKHLDEDTLKKLMEYRDEHLLVKKDVLFLKKFGVIVPMPTSQKTLEDRFFDAVIDSIFYRFRGKSISFDLEILSDILRFPIPKLKKMFNLRVEKGELEKYKRTSLKLEFYVNPYDKDYY